MPETPLPNLTKQPSWWHRIRLFAIYAVVGLTALIIAFFIEERIRGRAAWLAYETNAKSLGVKLDFSEFVPPEVPKTENFASIPLFDDIFRAAEANQPIRDPLELKAPMELRTPAELNDLRRQVRIDLAVWQKYFVKNKFISDGNASAAAGVLEALQNFSEPLAQFREAGRRPHCKFPIHWERGFAIDLPQTGVLLNAAKLFALRAAAHLKLGDSPAAYEDFRDGMRLASATAGEPSLSSGLVRTGIAWIMTNAVWGGLADHGWGEHEIQKIEADLIQLNWLEDYIFVMNSERCLSNAMLDSIIGYPRKRDGIFAGDNKTVRVAVQIFPTGWVYQNKLQVNHCIDEMVGRFDPANRRYFRDRPIPSSSLNRRGSMIEFYHYYFSNLMTPILEGVEERYLPTATVADQARIACALERFRLARGAFPESLIELRSVFMAEVPAQIVNGEPYCYHRTDDGSFVLYSVGMDLRDDGGVINQFVGTNKQKDWVWRYPAK